MYPRVQCLVLVVLSFTSQDAFSQDTNSQGTNSQDTTGQESQQLAKDQRALWMNVYSEEAAKYQMFRRGDEEQALELVPLPILTYTNPVRTRDTHGAAFVWTSEGRPEVVGAIWSVSSADDATKRNVSQEFHSLSLVPIRTQHEPRKSKRGLVPDWATDEPGISPKRIPNAQAPVTMPTLRLTQMRRLARRFEATAKPGLSDGQGSFRLLSQPVYRYRSESHGVLDGAVFAFVMGTDPELVLVIEAVESDEGPEWRFAAASLTNLPMRLDYQGTRVWECRRPVPFVGDRPHFLYYHVSARDRVIE